MWMIEYFSMEKIDKRFTILFSDEELKLLKSNAQLRGMSAAELIRLSVQNEVTQKSSVDRINALKRIHGLGNPIQEI